MQTFAFCLVQMNFIFGLLGLLWPERLMSIHETLMFPWPATHRSIRLYGIVAAAAYLFAVARFLLTVG